MPPSLAALALIAGAAPAQAAFGAFAYDEATGKYGSSWNEPDEKAAEEAALKGCASDKCKIVFRTKGGQCGAIAMTENGKIWGGATRPKREVAEKAAARKLPEARQRRYAMQGPRPRMQQMRRAVRRLLAVLALFLTVPGALPSNPAAAETIQLKKHAGGGYLIPGRINDAVAVTFVLDTGASDVSIPDEVARELEQAGKLDRGDFIGTRTYVLADGSKVPSRRVLLREVTVGGQTVSNVTASISRSGSPPLLGQSFLSKFASWTLDNERAVLVLKTKGDNSATSSAAESGGRPGASGPGGSGGARDRPTAPSPMTARAGATARAGTRPRKRGPTKRRSRAAPRNTARSSSA